MDDTTFFFVLLPLTAAFVLFMFTLVFGRDMLDWYLKRRTSQRLKQ